MLGTLAKWLRILGYNTAYDNRIEDHQLLARALREERLALTRDARLIRELNPPHCLLIGSENLFDQIQEVLEHLKIHPDPVRIMSRCLVCNSLLESTDPASVRDRVPTYVYATQSQFKTCPDCRRVYWGGTHQRNIYRKLLGRL